MGIDVSKGYADENSFQLDDTFDVHNRLYERLKNFLTNHPGAEIHSAVESTGGYEANWLNFLIGCGSSLNIKITCLNPLGVSMNSKADLKRNTTDKISARNVAEFMIAHPEKIMFLPKDPLASARKQWTFIQMLTKQNTQLLNQFSSA